MPKRVFKLVEFDGGENRTKDPRDLELNECAQAKGVDFDRLGRIRVAGSGVEINDLTNTSSAGINGNLNTVNFASSSLYGVYKLNSGYGIFSYKSDFNSGIFGLDVPKEISSEFIAIAYIDGSGLKIGFIDKDTFGDETVQGLPFFHPSVIDLGQQDNNPKINYYYVDNALRIFDGEFRNTTINTFYGHVKRDFFTNIGSNLYSVNSMITENQSLELSDNPNSNRPHENATLASASLQFKNALDYTASGYPDGAGEVELQIAENVTVGVNGTRFLITENASVQGITTITTSTNHPFNGGDMIEIHGASENATEIYNGQYEVIDKTGNTTFTIAADITDGALDNDNDSGTDTVQTVHVSKVEDMLNPELRTQWIYGISYVLDGKQETKIATASNSSGIMSSSNFDDWSAFDNKPQMRFSFRHISNTYQWSDRITGFRVYMKNVKGTTPDQVSQEWHLMIDTDFKKGIYTLPGTDSTEKTLTITSTDLIANHASSYDDLRFLSPITFESINGYSNEETIDAKFKTAVIANERAYIGNILQGGQLYPDRILKSPIGSYDVFPESSFIEGVTSDGDSIVKLEYYGDRLFCFKNNSLQLINLSDEEEYLEESLSGHGVDQPCQVVKTNNGIAYVNESGLYLHDGSESINLTQNKIYPFAFDSKDTSSNGFFFKNSIPNLGYDTTSNKLILVRSSRTADYDVDIALDNNQSINFAFQNSSGYVNIGQGQIPDSNKMFRLVDSDDPFVGNDFTGDDLSIAKHGQGGIALKEYDYFYIKSNNPLDEKIEYLDLDADAFIYDLNNNCFSLRNFAFGGNNIGYNMTNFINTSMFGGDILMLLKDASGQSNDGTDVEMIKWEDNPVAIEGMNKTFLYKTKDLDFGDPSVRKKIYKVYVTFKANDGQGTHVNSKIRVYHCSNQSSTFTEFDDSSSNYNSTNGLYSEDSSSDWQIAELRPSSSINNIYSFQLKFENTNGNVPKGFEINDISVVYRSKPIR